MIWFWATLGGIGLVLLALTPVYLERRRSAIGPTERHGATGDFARLSQGVTHFRWVGPVRGPVAVCIHGLATPMISMDEVAEGIGKLGYRVLMYDLYGRGLSDAPKGLQDRAYFSRQLSDLLAYHDLRDEVTLAGFSMGGAIATAFAAEHPHSIKQVFLIAPSGIIMNESRFSSFCRRYPFLGGWVHGMFAHGRIRRAIPDQGQTPEIDRVLRSQTRELKRRGYLTGILSSRRGMLSEIQEKEHRQLGRQGLPVTAIWASDDKIIPITALGRLAEWNRKAHHEVVLGADHALPYTHGPQLVAAMREAMRD